MATFGTFAAGQVLTAGELNTGIPICVLENNSVSLADAVNTNIPYTTEIRDTLGWHSPSSNNTRITPNIAGLYLVTVVINNVAGGSRALTGCMKNGSATDIPIFMDTPATIDDFTVTGYVTANGTTDYFEHRALQTSGGTKTGIRTQFSMQWVSA